MFAKREGHTIQDFNPLIYTDCKQHRAGVTILIGLFQPTHIHGLQVREDGRINISLRTFNPLIYTDCKGGGNSSTHLIPVFGFCEPH